MAWTNALITTRRVTLRCPTDEDRPAISRVLTDPDVRRFLGGPVSDEDLAAFASRPIGRQTGLFVAVLAETGRTIGTFALDDQRDDRELSYQLLPEFWGQGLALEACGALLTWGWTELDEIGRASCRERVSPRV